MSNINAYLSMFYGIIVHMSRREHMPPCLRARYREHTAYFDFEGNLLEGDLPIKKKKLIEAWIVIHSEELIANWKIFLTPTFGA